MPRSGLFFNRRSEEFSCGGGTLKSLQSQNASKLLKNDELECRCWSKTRPDGEESAPEGGGSFLNSNLAKAVCRVVIKLRISRLIHHPGADHVKRCDRCSHKESRAEGRKELSGNRCLRKTGGGNDIVF